MPQIVEDVVDISLTIDGNVYEIKELETEISRYNEVDTATATVIDRDFEDSPSQDETFELEINGIDVFKGYVNSVKFNGDGSFEVQVLTDLYRVKNEDIYISMTEEPTPLSEAVEAVCEQAGVEYNIDLEWYTSGGRTTAIDYNIGLEETGTKADKVLDKLARWSSSDWWFDRDNVLQFGLPDAELYELEYVFDTSASDMLPPYKGVKVVGDSIVSEKGWDYANIPGAEPVVAKSGIFYKKEGSCVHTTEKENIGEVHVPAPCWEVRPGQTNSPVFTLKDKQIKTAEQARQVADKLTLELFKQIRGGTVKIVGTQEQGTAALGPHDVIELPDHLGGERYYCGKVNHNLAPGDGYTIEVECEGLVPGRYGVDPITVEV